MKIAQKRKPIIFSKIEKVFIKSKIIERIKSRNPNLTFNKVRVEWKPYYYNGPYYRELSNRLQISCNSLLQEEIFIYFSYSLSIENKIKRITDTLMFTPTLLNPLIRDKKLKELLND